METTIDDMLLIIGELTVQLRMVSNENSVLRQQLEALVPEVIPEPELSDQS